MHTKLASILCLSMIAADAMAADTNTSSTQTAATHQVASRRIAAPLISETRATRMPDGSLALSCNDRPNPKAHATPQQTRSPQLNPNQQP